MGNRIFLGGTCAETTWRDELVKDLKVDYFNPVVGDWTPECQKNEIIEKEQKCNIHFYMITSAMKGVFSIAEVVDSVHNKEKITILHVNPTGFDNAQIKSMEAVVDLVNSRGGMAGFVSDKLNYSADLLNDLSSDQ